MPGCRSRLTTSLLIGVWCGCPASAAADQAGRSAVQVKPAVQVRQLPALDVIISVGPAADGAYVVEAESPVLIVRKALYASRTVLSLSARSERDAVLVVTEPGGITVTRGRRTTALLGRPSEADFQTAQALLQASPAVRAFRALAHALERAGDGPAAEALAMSGALVGLLDGDPSAVERLAARMRARLGATPRAAQLTPNECWHVYSRDAIQIYIEYEQCTASYSWYQLTDIAVCQFLYAIRAELAFGWLVSCSGGVFFK